MKDYTRLFDILKYQEQKYPRKDCLNYKYNGKWRNYSTQEVNEIVDKVSKSLIKLGVEKDDKIALISSNRPEWNFVDNGMLQIGAINVPIYPTISKDEYEYIRHLYNQQNGLKEAFEAKYVAAIQEKEQQAITQKLELKKKNKSW